MARPIGWLCICIGIAGLAGCAGKVPLAAPPPAVAMPAGWGAGESAHGETAHREPRPAQALDPDWWNRFGSAELARLVREGQGSNLELAAALSRVRQAEAQARIAGVSLLPTVDFGSGFDRALPI
ncbi:MAG: transporter, partial [Massilia sp.]|nr:transporter [Massilia sp.]